MSKIKTLSEVSIEYPDFTFGWYPITETLVDGTVIVAGFQHPNFGEVRRIVVCADEGFPKYDQYQIHEGPMGPDGRPATSGAVIVPYFHEDEIYIGMLERIREVVIDPVTKTQGQHISRELPRGFSRLAEMPEETAARELGEETGKYARKMRRLSRVNPNNAFYMSNAVVYAALMDPAITSCPECSEEPV